MKLNIGGAVAHYDRLIRELPVLKLRNKHIQFTVYDGPNLCSWNGGRINRHINLTHEMLERYNKFGISVALTFSNPVIDLNDPVGNRLLDLLYDTGSKFGVTNKVILINEDLRQYLKENYDFELIYSVSGHYSDITINDKLISYYHNLESKYDFIVPKFELIFDEDFYTQIDPSKYEIMTNDTCIHACPYWQEHFKAISNMNTQYKDPWLEAGYDRCFNVEECWLDDFNPDEPSDDEEIGMDLNRDMVQKALSIGYRSFKVSGRENPHETVMHHVMKYLDYLNYGKYY